MKNNKMKVYPIKFEPILKERIWGGEKLIQIFKKKSDKNNIGESWEISDVEGAVSIVENGELKGQSLRDLLKKFKGEFVGHKVYEQFGDDFPVLIKFIDAKIPLSIQVHPNNELAKERHNSFGKNEMWYIMDCDKDAAIIVGFNKEVSKEEYLNVLEEGKVLNILNSEKIKAGDTFYIPTGRVHAIGSGTVIAEIQQTSDLTYRIYDYERIDASTGQQRELHTDLSLDAIDYKLYDNYKTAYEIQENKSVTLVHSPYFKTDIIEVKGAVYQNYSDLDSFVIYVCVAGGYEIEMDGKRILVNKGETVFLPANSTEVVLRANEARILEVYF
ncbi:mannose-6-phosphate isomerase [Flavobacterium sp. 7E]|uniref:type I phosphomannose isomerase catalytic subunit n=1 Tax=Flavobacterium sp. 7E TaxID=2735898 RepID=UPI0020C6AFE6|nr:type I phosphomannose isomerase catalytic subunit [Flavobacterium sp. 7E]NRS89276.1 mannose-6-phosphate isomerase [Flavobacterium sp. 7E]